MKIVRESISFKRGTNPVDDMSLGNPLNKPAGIILQALVELFGDTVMLFPVYKSGEANFSSGPRRISTILRRTLDLSSKEWRILKKKIKEDIDPDFKWPLMYTRVIDSNDKEVKYVQVIEDIYGDEWYFDDADLVQNETTIVTVEEGMTFKEMIKKLQSNPDVKVTNNGIPMYLRIKKSKR